MRLFSGAFVTFTDLGSAKPAFAFYGSANWSV
jgi:hypothetical protein